MTSPLARSLPLGPPAPRWLHVAALVVASLGLAASLALLIDTLRPEPAFCGDGGGCASVKASAWSRPLGVPLPIPGVAFFALALVLLHTQARRLLTIVAVGGALVAAGLLVIEGAVLGTWCKLCVVTDSSALVFAALVALRRERTWPSLGRGGLALGGAFATLAIAVPLVLGLTAPPPAPPPMASSTMPDVVAREQRPGVVTIVDFIDFECPFCRRLHPRISAAIAAVGAPVRVVRKMMPLPDHAHALPAALAWCCADAQGKGDAMADALFAAPVAELSAEGCERIASKLGLDMAAYRSCVSSPATRERVAANVSAGLAAGVRSLPTIYIGEEAFVDANVGQDVLEAALRRALARARG